MALHFGQWLKSKRGRRGEPGFVSQAELARRMDVDPTYVSQLERKAEPPTHQTRQKIHAALGTTEQDLKDLGIIRDIIINVPLIHTEAKAHDPSVTTIIRPGEATAAGGTHQATASATGQAKTGTATAAGGTHGARVDATGRINARLSAQLQMTARFNATVLEGVETLCRRLHEIAMPEWRRATIQAVLDQWAQADAEEAKNA